MFTMIHLSKITISAILLLASSMIFTVDAFWTSNSETLSSMMRGSSNNNQPQQHQNSYHYKNRDMQLEDLLSQGEEKCINKPCVQSEQCCPGSVCVDLHSSTGKHQVTGTCLPIYGVNEGDSCLDDGDCESGLRCMPNQISMASSSSISDQLLQQQQTSGTCQPPGQEMMKKQYNEECTTSSQCDSSRGLCCQLIKRHRMAPRKACLYFSDSKVCLGSVDVTFARPASNYYYKPGERDYFRARIG